MSPVVQVLILALIQGLTEFLPVSSSGHLVIAQELLHFRTLPLLFDIVLHAGTLLAVLAYFRRELIRLALRPFERENRRLILLVILASLPTALIALLFRHFFEGLFTRPRAVGVGLLVTALLLWLSRRLRWRVGDPRLAAVLIGLFQGLAIVPGISRSGTTIALGLMLGLGAEFSFRFSFLLAIPAVLGAMLLEIRHLAPTGAPWLLLGLAFGLAALIGLFALGVLKRLLVGEKLHLFAYYCLLAGILVIAFF